MRNDLIRYIRFLAARNEDRLVAWRARWSQTTGRPLDIPAHVSQRLYGLPFPLQGHWPTTAECRAQWLPRPVATNANVVHIQHHRRQYRGATLPTGPEAA